MNAPAPSAKGLRDRLRAGARGRALLRALSWLYGAAVLSRRLLYRLRLLPSKRLPARTICIGNLTTGGTGKTSAVLLAADTLHKRRLKAAILSRGYKRPKARREVQVLLNTQNVSWRETGDEPWMLHHALKGLDIPILISPDRYRAGLEASCYYDTQVLLLDDGFQHLRLRRDLDVVLVDAKDPFGGGHLLPLGDLREPLSGLKRAGLLVITHADRAAPERLEELRGLLRQANPDAPILTAAHRPRFLFDLKTERKRRLAYLQDKPVCCLCAIGDPGSFEDSLRRIEARPIQIWRYPDHHPYTAQELRSLEAARAGLPVVTTFKDIPRLPPGWQEVLLGEVLALGVRLELLEGEDAWEAALCGELSSRS